MSHVRIIGWTVAPALVVAVLAPQTPLPPAWAHWRYAAPIALPTVQAGQLVSVTVPETIVREARSDWADLRLVDDSGREVPFVLRARTGRVAREPRQARLLDLSYAPGAETRLTVDLGAEPAVHNGLEIQTGRQDFLVRVTIDGSTDARDWRVLEQGAPIYRFAAHNLQGNQAIRYPSSTARYLRLHIRDGDERFPLEGVRVWHEVREEPELVAVDVDLRLDAHAPLGESRWTADRGTNAIPVSQVAFAVTQQRFHRPVRVRTSGDGKTWRVTGRGDIYRMDDAGSVRERLRVEFSETRAPFLRVEVVNRSDPPLAGTSLTLYGTPRHVVFRAEQGRAYTLIYGNPRATAAQYELARLSTAAALDSAMVAALGPPTANSEWLDPNPWTERHPIVLWGALLVAVIVLGLLAIRALRTSAA